jgi:DNA-binding response OmpR family regulator
MNGKAHRALIVSTDPAWRQRIIPPMLRPGWDVYAVNAAGEGADLLTKKRFDVIVIDDSTHDMDQPEFCFTVADLANNDPLVLVAGEDTERFKRVWEYCNIHAVGTRENVGRELPSALYQAERGNGAG